MHGLCPHNDVVVAKQINDEIYMRRGLHQFYSFRHHNHYFFNKNNARPR